MSLYLIGGGGFAGEVLEALGARATAVAGVFDDDPRLGATGPHRLPFLGGIDAALRQGGVTVDGYRHGSVEGCRTLAQFQRATR